MEKEKIMIFDIPQEVEVGDWLFSHPECDSIIEYIPDSKMMKVFAYALSKSGNRELSYFRKEKYAEKRLLRGVSEYAVTGGVI